MAEINKLSVGQALDKLRGTEGPRPRMSQLDEKIDALDEEITHLRATRHRVERGQRAASATDSAQDVNSGRDTGRKLVRIALTAAIFILTLAWIWMFI